MIKTHNSSEKSVDGIKFIELRGSLDVYNAQDVASYITLILSATKEDIIIYDLKELEFISSQGIASLVSVNSTFQNLKKIYFLNANNKIIEMFNLLGLKESCIFISDIKEIHDKNYLFPLTIECSSCQQKFQVRKAGRFKCPSCKTVISINKKGEIK